MAIREATTSVAKPARPRPHRAAECARSGARTVDPKQVQNRLALLRVFSDDMAALLQQETAEWVLGFQSSLLRLERSNTPRSGSVPLHGAVEP